MSEKLDMDQIARGLGAQRKGKVKSTGGYFGAMQLGAEGSTEWSVAVELDNPAPSPGAGETTRPTVDRRWVVVATAVTPDGLPSTGKRFLRTWCRERGYRQIDREKGNSSARFFAGRAEEEAAFLPSSHVMNRGLPTINCQSGGLKSAASGIQGDALRGQFSSLAPHRRRRIGHSCPD